MDLPLIMLSITSRDNCEANGSMICWVGLATSLVVRCDIGCFPHCL